MINITVFESVSGNITGFRIEGHAGQADKGKDIVCSAVSAVAYTALGALEEVAGAAGIVKNHVEENGYMEVNAGETGLISETADIILKTAVVGFRQIEDSYRKYVKITYGRNSEV